MSKILVIIFVMLANKVAAGYHVAFDLGFAEFAQQQGFDDFSDFLSKRGVCGNLILNSNAIAKVNVNDTHQGNEKDVANKASNLLFELLLDQNTKSIADLFEKIDKELWNSNNCKLAMFVETNILTDILEINLTGARKSSSAIKMPKPKNDYGYGY